MSSWEKPWRSERSQRRRKTPSFSSSLLEAIYHSIDGEAEEKQTPFAAYKRNNGGGGGGKVEEEITSLRRAIMLEKWMENYTRNNSDSSSSTDSSLFSSSETESAASRSTPKSSIFPAKNQPTSAAAILCEGNQKREGRFMRTKSRALKIYGDLKKVKQPISPGGKIANFLNSIFNSRSNNNMTKKHPENSIEDWSSSLRKSRSVKDSTMAAASRSCLNKTPSSRPKSKRSVRFCPVSVILDEDCQPCGHKNTYEISINNSFGDFQAKNHCNSRRIIYDENSSSDDDDEDNRSCTSSDLFELENVGSFSRAAVDASAAVDELPVYGTTNLKINQAIANGLHS